MTWDLRWTREIGVGRTERFRGRLGERGIELWVERGSEKRVATCPRSGRGVLAGLNVVTMDRSLMVDEERKGRRGRGEAARCQNSNIFFCLRSAKRVTVSCCSGELDEWKARIEVRTFRKLTGKVRICGTSLGRGRNE